MASNPILITHRDRVGKKAAIVFVHGYGGSPEQTWGKFPNLLKNESKIHGWDLYSFGYPSTLWLDLAGIWKADPPIETLAEQFHTTAMLEPLSRYDSLTIVAHSMGGLVVQKALVDYDDLVDRVSDTVFFGTPSGGLIKATFFKFWKRQFQGMAAGGSFISKLRAHWEKQFGAEREFNCWVVAGNQDEFVPRGSSIEPFPESQRCVIQGDHLSITKPTSHNDQSFKLLVHCLTSRAAKSGPVDAALLSVETRQFYKTIKRLKSTKDLDEDGLVELALALEGVGKPDEAIKTLKEQMQPNYTDAMGTLAGRLKRRWLMQRGRNDGQQALKLYRDGYDLAKAAGNPDQCLYLGINVAFMNLALGNDHKTARAMAEEVLIHCAETPRDTKWALATEGEAYLLLGRPNLALDRYRTAAGLASLKRQDVARRNLSMYQQAIHVCSLVGDREMARRLESIFRTSD